METVNINIGKQFSKYPAGRYPADGKFNGETFRKTFLVEPLKLGCSLVIFLDDALGYGSSFLEEAFGGLVRHENLSRSEILRLIDFKTRDSNLIYEIKQYVSDAESIF